MALWVGRLLDGWFCDGAVLLGSKALCRSGCSSHFPVKEASASPVFAV